MTRKELINLVQDIIAIENKTAKEIDELLDLLEQNVPDPNVSDLIYYDELTPERIIDKALIYKPIQL